MRGSPVVKQAVRRTLTRISPLWNTKFSYRAKFHHSLNLDKPETLNEKILWLKFHDFWNNDLVTQCADKYRVRQYVEQAGCGELLNELYGVYRTPEEIDWDALPDRFVLKLNVASGFNHIVFDKASEDKAALIAQMHGWLKEGPKFYLNFSEMQYKDVEPLILAEKYLEELGSNVPVDYKLHCFNGKCIMTMACLDRVGGGGTKFFYYDRDWNMTMNFSGVQGRSIEKPKCLDRAMQLAEKLAEPFPFVRVDFYFIEDRIIFGEMTFTPCSGLDQDLLLKPEGSDEDLDHIYGRLLKLPID